MRHCAPSLLELSKRRSSGESGHLPFCRRKEANPPRGVSGNHMAGSPILSNRNECTPLQCQCRWKPGWEPLLILPYSKRQHLLLCQSSVRKKRKSAKGPWLPGVFRKKNNEDFNKKIKNEDFSKIQSLIR